MSKETEVVVQPGRGNAKSMSADQQKQLIGIITHSVHLYSLEYDELS